MPTYIDLPHRRLKVILKIYTLLSVSSICFQLTLLLNFYNLAIHIRFIRKFLSTTALLEIIDQVYKLLTSYPLPQDNDLNGRSSPRRPQTKETQSVEWTSSVRAEVISVNPVMSVPNRRGRCNDGG